MSGSMLKLVDFLHSQESIKKEMEDKMKNKMNENKNYMRKKMDENKEEMQINMQQMEQNMGENMEKMMDKKMEEFQNSILQTLDGRIPKSDTVTHENKGSIHVEQPVSNKKFSSGFNSNSGVNYGGDPKFKFPKIELNKFDVTKVFS
jgi:alanyl-tRNA synthetase